MSDVRMVDTAEAWTVKLKDWLDVAAHEAGFDAVSIARVPNADEPIAVSDAERFKGWVDAGRAGEMEYLKRRDNSGTLVRSGPHVSMPWARSVIVCALNYNTEGPRSTELAAPGTGWIGRYAWSGRMSEDGPMVPSDYHHELLRRLRQIEAALQQRIACTTRSYVDTGPLLERNLAAHAGVGWIGKNTCVINQKLGSWLLLGVIVTSLSVEETTASMQAADRCGSCTRCIDACPTDALLGSKEPGAPREMDASRCIAYLTIEKKGAIDEALRTPMGRQVFGCDICQDVCPWNRRAPIGDPEGMRARAELINPALDWFATMDAKEFRRRFKGSPLERTGRKRLLRNVAIAMGNSGELCFLPQLEEWTSGPSDLAAGEPPEAIADIALRDAARWARKQILKGSPDR